MPGFEPGQEWSMARTRCLVPPIDTRLPPVYLGAKTMLIRNITADGAEAICTSLEHFTKHKHLKRRNFVRQSDTDRISNINIVIHCSSTVATPINSMVAGYLSKYTHRTTHVESHKRWLDGKNAKELSDWEACGEHDCLYGAVLRGMQHGGFFRGAPFYSL
jgi:hypothetical protein